MHYIRIKLSYIDCECYLKTWRRCLSEMVSGCDNWTPLTASTDRPDLTTTDYSRRQTGVENRENVSKQQVVFRTVLAELHAPNTTDQLIVKPRSSSERQLLLKCVLYDDSESYHYDHGWYFKTTCDPIDFWYTPQKILRKAYGYQIKFRLGMEPMITSPSFYQVTHVMWRSRRYNLPLVEFYFFLPFTLMLLVLCQSQRQ